MRAPGVEPAASPRAIGVQFQRERLAGLLGVFVSSVARVGRGRRDYQDGRGWSRRDLQSVVVECVSDLLGNGLVRFHVNVPLVVARIEERETHNAPRSSRIS